MDRIGSINKRLARVAVILANMDEQASQVANSTPEALTREEGYQQSLGVLQQLAESSVGTILFVEHSYIAKDLEHTKNHDKEASLLKAIDQIHAAREMLSLTEDSVEYKKMVKYLPPQEKEKDLPRDTVIRFFESHKKRLKNFITYASNDSEWRQAILNQRLLNIKKAEGSYIQVQREILGDDWRPMPDPSIPTLDSTPTDGYRNMSTEEIKEVIDAYDKRKNAYAQKKVDALPLSQKALACATAKNAKTEFDWQHPVEAKEVAALKKILEEREPKEPNVQKHHQRDDHEL